MVSQKRERQKEKSAILMSPKTNWDQINVSQTLNALDKEYARHLDGAEVKLYADNGLKKHHA